MSEEIKVKEVHRNTANSLAGESSINDTVISYGKDAFEKYGLAEGQTLEQAIAAQRACSDFIAAVSLATGEIAAKHMAEHKDIDTMTATVPIGKNKLEVSFRREVEVSDGKGGRKMKKGAISTKYRYSVPMTRVKQHLSNLAADLLK